MKNSARWTTVFAFGAVAIAGTGIYFHQQTGHSRDVAAQSVVLPAADPTSDIVPPSERLPQPVAYPATSSAVQTGPGPANSGAAPSVSHPTAEQQQIFDRLRDRLHDQAFRLTHTYREFLIISLPEWELLPKDMQSQLLAEMNSMIEKGDFSPKQFVAAQEAPEPMAAMPVPPAALPPTAEQQRMYESLRSKLYDPEFTQTRTLGQLALLPELQTLPAELRQQLEREVMEMLDRGELQLRPEARASSEL